MATTSITKTLTADDSKILRPQDLRNPMFHLLNAEKFRNNAISLAPLSTKLSQTSSSVLPSSKNDRKRHFLPQSVCDRVEKSWDLVQHDLENVGLNFFIRIFESSPELLALLPYGQSYLDTPPSQRKEKLRQCPLLRVHSVHVMTAVGNCVAGLNDIESLIPSLRALGRTHRMAGVDEGHYKMLFGHLSGSIRDKIGRNWDEETAEAWELVYFSLAAIMYGVPLEAEAVTGWHEALVMASFYLVVSTPYRLAGFASQVYWAELVFTCLDTISLLLFVVDLFSESIVDAFRVKSPKSAWAAQYSRYRHMKSKSPLRRRFEKEYLSLKVHAMRKVRSLQIDQWVSWPTTDKFVISSFILQYFCFYHLGCKQSVGNMSSATVGLHWINMVALLLRLAAIMRVFHAIRCTENLMLLRKRVQQNNRMVIRVTKLLLTLAYVTHVSACLWCIVARVQLGPSAIDALPSDFFPEPSLLLGKAGVINSYIRALHWSWVNLAGIGNFDSTPITTLECIVNLLIHVCGVTLYAITTGNVVAILEECTSQDNQVGNELADLGTFMNDCQIPGNIQERIMQGYLMRNMITAGKDSGDDEEFDGEDTPSISDSILGHLPRHLQNELRVYSRAEALQRRERSFQNCSADFLFALSGELHRSRILLPGDYLCKNGDVPQQIIVVDSGTMEVQVDGKTVKMLRKGNTLGKPWLLKALHEENNGVKIQKGAKDEIVVPIIKHEPHSHSFSEWLDFCQGSDYVKVRAMTNVRLATGLSLPHEVRSLKKRFPKDFAALLHDRERVVDAMQKVRVTRNVIRAQLAFKRQLKHATSA